MASLPVIPSELPQGFCPSTYQDLLNEFSSHQSVDLTIANGVSVGQAKPLDKTLPWLRLDQFGRPDRLYYFSQGAWLALHSLVPGLTQWWFDALPDFTTFDGGDTNPASALSGPMWQQAKNSDGTLIAAMFPIPAGTLPSSTVLTQGDTGGEEKHVLTGPELPATFPPLAATLTGFKTNLEGGAAPQWLAPQGSGSGSFTVPAQESGTFSFTNTGGSQGHNTMPPYVVGYLLQRSARLFYAISA